MRLLKFIIFFVTLSVVACSQSAGTDDDGQKKQIPDPFVQNQLLQRTINLGNALEAPSEGEWGLTLQEEHFEIIADAGFSAVRIPIRWSAHTSANAPYSIDPLFMARILWALAQAEKNGLAAVINIHHFDEIFENPPTQKAKFLSLWKQLAERFVSEPNSVFYEILNEPHDNLTADLWNNYLADAIDSIRTIDSTHTVIVGTAEWGGLAALNKLQLPPDEKNMIVTFHYYEPFQFTHQGAEWVEGSEAWLNTPWQGTTDEKNDIINDFNRVKSWAEAHNVPVFLGEFGAYNKAEMSSRARWTAFITQTAESDSMGWAYWEFASGFGVYNPDNKQWRNELLNALIH